MIGWLIFGIVVTAVIAKALYDDTDGDSVPFAIFGFLVYVIVLLMYYWIIAPDSETVRDCTIHKELRNTEYCDGVDYENGDNK